MPAYVMKRSIQSCLYAIYAFGFLVLLDPRPINESREQFAYFMAVAFVLGAWLLGLAVNRFFRGKEEFEQALDSHMVLLIFWLVLSVWSAFFGFAIGAALALFFGLSLSTLELVLFPSFPKLAINILSLLAIILLVILSQTINLNYLLLALLCFVLLLVYQKYPQGLYQILGLYTVLFMLAFLPIPIGSLAFAWFFYIGCILIIVYAIGLSRFVEKLSMGRNFHLSGSKKRLLMDIFACILLLSFTFDFRVLYDTFHYNPYNATVIDVIHGRTVLVDTFSIYGASINYFLAAPFTLNILPFTSYSMSLINNLMTCLEILAIYGIMRALTQSIRWSSFAAGIVIVFHLYIGASNFLNVPLIALPAPGVLRFGWLYFLFFFVAWRYRSPKYAMLFRGIELLLVAVIASWSLEAIVFVIPAYLASLAYEALQKHSGDWLKALKSFLPQVLAVIIAMLLGIGLLCLYTWMRSGELPRFDVYLNYVLSLGYSNQNYAQSKTFLVRFWSPWPLFVLIYAICLLAIAHIYTFKRFVPAPVLGLVLAGVLNLLYWVGNSGIPASQVVVPLMLLAYGLYLLQKNQALREVFNSATIAGLLIVFLYYMLQVNYPYYSAVGILYAQLRGGEIPPLLNLADNSPIYRSVYRDGGLIERDLVAEDIAALAQEYMPDEEFSIIFAQNEPLVMALMHLGRANYFPLTGEFEDSLNPRALELALERSEDALNQLRAGRRMITMRDWENIGVLAGGVISSRGDLNISQSLLSRICEGFGIQELAMRETGVVVLELVNPSPETSCGLYWQMD